VLVCASCGSGGSDEMKTAVKLARFLMAQQPRGMRGLDGWKDSVGATPFWRACMMGNLDIVRYLNEAGADVDQADN